MLAKKRKLPVGGFSPRAHSLKRGKFVLAKTIPNNLGVLRVGIVVSHKHARTAVIRNAVKRVVFNYFRLPKTDPQPSTDLLIIIAAPIIKFDSQTKDELLRDLESVKTLLLRHTSNR